MSGNSKTPRFRSYAITSRFLCWSIHRADKARESLACDRRILQDHLCRRSAEVGIDGNTDFTRACGQALQAAAQRLASPTMGALLRVIGEGPDQQIATEA